ncbi:MAG: KTSC domain-containing protein [Ginsengibacter sp.]
MPSSVVSSIQYDASKAVLTIIFVSGMVYKYKDVPESNLPGNEEFRKQRNLS